MAGFVAAVAACGGGDGDDTPSSRVTLTFDEWSIAAEPADVTAGEITFALVNDGDAAHNLVIVKSDLPPGELPVSDEAVDKSRLNVEGGAGPIAPGPAPTDDPGYTVSLSPGKYVLFCDVVIRDGANVESHYRNGMYASFFVEP